MINKSGVKAVILATSSLTVMSGAIIAPALPEISEFFAENHEILKKLVLTLPALAIALLAGTAGKLIDLHGRKKILLVSLLLYAVAGTAGYFISHLWVLLASRALLGVAVAGAMSTATTLIGDYFEGNERNKFMGIQASFMAFGGVIFLNLGGILADWSWRGPFLVYSFAFLILPFAVYFIQEPSTKTANDDGVNELSHPLLIRFIYFMGFSGMLFFYLIPVQVPFLLKSATEVSNSLIGLAISVSTITGAIISANFSKIRAKLSPSQIYTISFIFMAIGYFIISLTNTYATVVAGLAVSGLGAGIILPNGSLWLIQIAKPQNRGKAMGGLTAAIFLGQFLSPVLSTPLVNVTSLQQAFLVASFLLLIFAALPILVTRKMKS